MIPLHTAPSQGRRFSLSSLTTRLRALTVSSVSSTLSSHLRTSPSIAKNVASEAYNNHFLKILFIFFVLWGYRRNARYSFSHTLTCAANGSCTLSIVSGGTVPFLGKDNYESKDIFRDVFTDEIKCSQVRVNPVTGDHHASTSGFTRKQKRRLKYGYLISYIDSSDTSVTFLMGGKRGVGRKKSVLRCNTIKRYFERKGAGEELKEFVIKESMTHTTVGVLLYVAAAMVAVWGIILWTLEE
eukprot:CAMPEP_0182470524 /NCGR_PEP_ID=MMETSP1319-20130603/18847_1 /TAXON_ID=172717 /ORGANISM="Bolidomonas pacifica, Strain RCC208" /LENGTH=240 /DNA_ID=CAMNT_0024670979 /DNA_START=142 /DNA_END=861 /DNA_ORIENTATION=+